MSCLPDLETDDQEVDLTEGGGWRLLHVFLFYIIINIKDLIVPRLLYIIWLFINKYVAVLGSFSKILLKKAIFFFSNILPSTWDFYAIVHILVQVIYSQIIICSYSRSRSRSYGARNGRRRGRDRSHSPMSSRRRHRGNRDDPDPNRCIGVFGLSLDTREREIEVWWLKIIAFWQVFTE